MRELYDESVEKEKSETFRRVSVWFVKEDAAELHNLLSTLADIRTALGVGDKLMLGELAGIVRTRMGVIKILERDAKDHAAEVKRLMAERDEMRNARDVLRQVAEKTEGLRREVEAERDAVARERDAAVEALRFYAEEDRQSVEIEILESVDLRPATAVLAGIEGERDEAVEVLKEIAAVTVDSFIHHADHKFLAEWMQDKARSALAKIEGRLS